MSSNSTAEVERVVLLEFPDEADAYVNCSLERGIDPGASRIISLDPKTEACLRRQGIDCVSSLSYFTSASHARALRRSRDLQSWLEQRFSLEDQLGVKDAYTNALLWYGRYSSHHMLWLSEILADVHQQHPDAVIQAPLGHITDSEAPLIQTKERYLGPLAKAFCNQQGIRFEAIDSCPEPSVKRHGRRDYLGIRRLVYTMGAHLHRRALRKLGRKRPLISLTRGYRMDTLVSQAMQHLPQLPWAVVGEGARSSRGIALLRRALQAITAGSEGRKGLYIGEVWLRFLEQTLADDPDFAADLADQLNRLARDVEAETELFTHRGVPFGQPLATKLRSGIGPEIGRMNREIRALDNALEVLQPRLLLTPFGRRSYHALGELARHRNIPGLLISHGSFTPTKNDLEETGWGFHAFGMLYGSYTHAGLQTPLAEAFANNLQTTTRFVRTGPLVWGVPANRNGSQTLRERLTRGQPKMRLVVHAGTPKPRDSIHLHLYETPDEYIAALQQLVAAVEQVPDVFLVIKYRPLGLTVDELRILLPSSERCYISVAEPFPEVLGITDLLVSFSSTTIEEALQNQVPVLLYGGEGRYQHIEAFEVSPDTEVEPRAVYAVRSSDYLADALERILNVNGPAPLPPELFEQYVYRPEDITPFHQLVANLVSNDFSDATEIEPLGPNEGRPAR